MTNLYGLNSIELARRRPTANIKAVNPGLDGSPPLASPAAAVDGEEDREEGDLGRREVERTSVDGGGLSCPSASGEVWRGTENCER